MCLSNGKLSVHVLPVFFARMCQHGCFATARFYPHPYINRLQKWRPDVTHGMWIVVVLNTDDVKVHTVQYGSVSEKMKSGYIYKKL